MKAARPSNLHAAALLKMLEHEIHAAWADKDLEKAKELLFKALKSNSKHTTISLWIGKTYGAGYEYSEAEDWFREAVEGAPKNERLAVLIRAGTMAGNFFDPSIAESFLSEAAKLADHAAAKLALAEHQLRSRKTAQARELIEQALHLEPENPLAALWWCKTHESNANACIEKLRGIIKKSPSDVQAKAGYQLAKMLDKTGDYDGAFAALVAAKQVLMPARDLIVLARERIRVRHKEMAETLSQKKLASWMEALSRFGLSRKLALLGGHPRSGTTLLEQVLDSHPDIVSAEESENFDIFAMSPLLRRQSPLSKLIEVLDTSSEQNIAACRGNYFDAMDRCIGEPVGSRLLIDKNPSLTSLTPALCRVFPEMKFMVMIRDPRDVILSCFMQSFVPVTGVNGNYLTLEDATAEYLGMMSAWKLASRHLGDRALEIRYEDMVDDLESAARKTLGFLGADWNEAVMNYDEHARGKIVRSPTANAVTQKVHGHAKNRWRNYQKRLAPAIDRLGSFLNIMGYE
jgi:tetratricopeptide (TPR) repeat protein